MDWLRISILSAIDDLHQSSALHPRMPNVTNRLDECMPRASNYDNETAGVVSNVCAAKSFGSTHPARRENGLARRARPAARVDAALARTHALEPCLGRFGTEWQVRNTALLVK